MSSIEENHVASRSVSRTAGKASFELGRVQAVVVAVVAALLVNLVIYAVAALAGGSFEFTDGDKTNSAAPVGVIFLTVVPLVIGMALAALLSYRWLAVIRIAEVVGSVLALLTIFLTLQADFDGPSTVALSIMHVTLVPALVFGLESMRRRLVRQRAGA